MRLMFNNFLPITNTNVVVFFLLLTNLVSGIINIVINHKNTFINILCLLRIWFFFFFFQILYEFYKKIFASIHASYLVLVTRYPRIPVDFLKTIHHVMDWTNYINRFSFIVSGLNLQWKRSSNIFKLS